jgi:hypothetical protein
MEFARQTFILPRPTSGDICWTLHITSGREHPDVFANAQGILGTDLSGTQWAKQGSVGVLPAHTLRVEIIRGRLFMLARLSGRIFCVAGTQG